MASLKQRIAVGALSLSMAGFVALATRESYVADAMIPTKNDRPTVGFGSTFHEDGRPVKMGDKTTPVRALIKAQAHITKEEERFRASIPEVELHQAEYDLYMDWVYQFGAGRWASSSMHANLLAGDYVQACHSLLRYKFSGGFDCSTPGNRVCSGVWTEQQNRHAKCMAAQ
ncbi:lysozyme [Rhodoferax ferrireducens]|uniref:lysozyme n=1 Tax=Rhodoferax ferrireducens TaxID=192843 RepID=UPI000E0D0581|nr:lysozyme [Rhodoferax ferrireducens]